VTHTAASGRNRSRLAGILIWAGPLVFLLLFYFFPLGSILDAGLSRAESGAAAPLLEAWRSPITRRALWFTTWQAAVSTLLTLLVGLPGAYLFARYQFRGKRMLQALAGIPFVMPTLVVAAAFNALLGPRGWVNIGLMALFDLAAPPIQFSQTLGAILLAHVFYNTTIVLRMVGDFWAHLDPRLQSAARTLGASPWQTARRVTLPLLLPAILAAALLVFIFDFSSFGVILILGGPAFITLEVEIFYQTTSLFNLPLAAALSVIQLVCNLALTIAYTRLSNRISRPLTLRARRGIQRPLRGLKQRLTAGAVIILIFSLLLTPLAALAVRSVTRLEPERGSTTVASGFTLDFYRALAEDPRQSIFYGPPSEAIAVSLSYAALTVVFSLLLGIPAAWALARRGDSTLSRVFDPIIMLPMGTSAVTLGLGFIVALSGPPLYLSTSPLLIPFAHTLVAFPFTVRSLTPALRSIQPRLHLAAASLGARPGQIFRAIDLPLAGRAAIVAATFAFTISLGEFGATAVIARPEYATIPIAIYRFLGQPGAMNYGQALALSTILMVVSGGGLLFIERLRIGDIGEF